MQAALIALSIATTPAAAFETPSAAAVALAEHVQTGTLLFSEGDCLAVKIFTGSPYTHVAAIVVEEDKAVVYDSQNGVGVRRLPLDEYLSATRPDTLHVLQPAQSFDEVRRESFRSHLEEELGREYAVRHHLTGQRCEGLHCAEYLTDALIAARLVRADRPPRVSPASLRSGLLRHDLYVVAETLELAATVPDEDSVERGWCEELWFDTKECCANCWIGFRRRVFCR